MFGIIASAHRIATVALPPIDPAWKSLPEFENAASAANELYGRGA
jgi:hypothetical protein